MAWDPTKPATNAPLASAEVRANWAALDAALMAALAALANGQVLYKVAGPALGGVPAGTNGFVLTLVGGVPIWQAAAGGGVTFPLLAPDGSVAAPSYSFANATGAGFYIQADGSLILRSPMAIGLVANGLLASSWWIGEQNAWMPGVDAAYDLGRSDFRIRDLRLSRLIDYTALGASPATPPAGHVVTYAKTDKKLYAKDDAGTETQLGGSGSALVAVPLPLEAARFPDGTAGNLFPQPVERVSTGTVVGIVPKLVELCYQFDATAIEWLIFKGRVPDGYAGGVVTLSARWSMLSATSGNVRAQAALGAIAPGAGDARAVVTTAAVVSADQAVPGTLGVIAETRLTMTGPPTLTPGGKFLLALSLYAGGASSATGDRVLESAALEFAL